MQNYQKIIAIQNFATLKSFNRCFSSFISTLFFKTEPYFSLPLFILDKKMFLFHFLLLPLLVLHFLAHKA